MKAVTAKIMKTQVVDNAYSFQIGKQFTKTINRRFNFKMSRLLKYLDNIIWYPISVQF